MGGGGGGRDPVHRLVRGGPPPPPGWPSCHRGRRRAPAARATWRPGPVSSATWASAMATKAMRGQITAADAPLAKIWWSELNLEIAETALALQGARSMAIEGDELSDEDGRWQDMFLYARAYTIAGGSNEIMRNLIAERGLGLPREPRRPVVTSTSRHPHPVQPPHAQRARGAAAANDPFPGVEKVRDGLWSIPVPLPNNSLRYVLVYVFETDRGPYLIDAGWNTDDAFGALQRRHGGDRLRTSPTSRASWSPTSIPTTTGSPAGSARRPARGSPSTPPTPSSSTTATTSPSDLLDRVAAALRRMGAPAEELRTAAERRHAAPAAGRPRRPRPAARGRGTARGAGLGPDRPSGRRVTRRATCASTSPPAS